MATACRTPFSRMSTTPSNLVSDAPATPPTVTLPHDDIDLAGCVDQLLAEIDSSSASLAQQVDELASTPEVLAPDISSQELLSQVDQLLQDVASSSASMAQPPNPVADAAPVEVPPAGGGFEASPVFADGAAPAAVQAEPVPASEPAPSAPRPEAVASQSIRSLDDEMSKIGDEMLETTPAAESFGSPASSPSPSAPALLAGAPATKGSSQPAAPDLALSATVSVSKPTLGSRLQPVLVALLTPLSAPLAKAAPPIRHSVGWIAFGSLFFASVLWVVVLTRKPAELLQENGAFDFEDGTPPQLPVAHADPHAAPSAAGGHGEAAKSEGHGKAADPHDAAKSKTAKKAPPRKNRAASKPKKDAAAPAKPH